MNFGFPEIFGFPRFLEVRIEPPSFPEDGIEGGILSAICLEICRFEAILVYLERSDLRVQGRAWNTELECRT